MPKYKKNILEVVNRVDMVFDEIGRDFSHSQKNMVISGLSTKSFSIINAIILLCDGNYNSEATILLRSLIENTIKLRWLLNKDVELRINEYFQKPEDFSWGKQDKVGLKDKMSELGFSDEYYNKVIRPTCSYSHANSESINWFPVLKIDKESGLSSGAIYSIAYQMLGHVLKVFNDNLSEEFNFYDEIFQELQKEQKPK